MPIPEELSHNLRTPLTSIRLALDLCIRRAEALPPEALKEILHSALEQTKKLELAILEAERQATTSLPDEEDNVIVLQEESAERIRVVGRKALGRR